MTSVIINNFNLVGVGPTPDKADAILVIHPDTVLTGSITGQRLGAIPRWNAHVIEGDCRIELIQLADGYSPHVLRTCSACRGGIMTVEDVLGAHILE